MAEEQKTPAESPAKKTKKPVDTIVSIDHQNGTVVFDTDRPEGEPFTAKCNDQQRTAHVTGGQLWYNFDQPFPQLLSVVIN